MGAFGERSIAGVAGYRRSGGEQENREVGVSAISMSLEGSEYSGMTRRTVSDRRTREEKKGPLIYSKAWEHGTVGLCSQLKESDPRPRASRPSRRKAHHKT